MKTTHCKISRKAQYKLLYFFVAEVMARLANNLIEIESNTAALCYHKIRKVISANLALQCNEKFGGEIELDESNFGGTLKVNMGESIEQSHCLWNSETQWCSLHKSHRRHKN